MKRRDLGTSQGMLFVFEHAVLRVMWMKHTPLSLDMIFINDRGEIVDIAKNAEAYSEKRIVSLKPARFVLEVLGGTAKRLGLQRGQKVQHALILTP